MRGLEKKRGQACLGVALGGGTARGFAHIGVLRVLERSGTPPDMLAGNSFGAIIAALYALGVHAEELEYRVRQQNVAELWLLALDFGLHKASLINGQRLEHWLDRKLFFGATFADTEIPLAISCTDVDSGELVVLREGSLARAVRASCALPGIFTTVNIAGRNLIDGGFITPVPVAPLTDMGASAILGVHAGIEVDKARFVSWAQRFYASNFGRWLQDRMLSNSFKSAWGTLAKGLARAAASYSRVIAYPPEVMSVSVVPPIAWWDFHKSPRAIAAGEAAMSAALPALLAQLAEAQWQAAD